MTAYDSLAGAEDAFAASRSAFGTLVEDLSSPTSGAGTHGELEEQLLVRGRELLRQVFQDELDRRAKGEERLPEVAGSDQVVRRAAEPGHSRLLTCLFGTVEVKRYAYRAKGHPNLYPADSGLDLPAGKYSLGLRKLAALEAVRGSFDDAQAAIERTTGVRIGKRQLEELTRTAAKDIADFYDSNRPDPDDSNSNSNSNSKKLLVASVDGKGVVMLPAWLREHTRKQAEAKAVAGGPALKTR